MQHDRLLIISSSGDGGYHEVINGVMRAFYRLQPFVIRAAGKAAAFNSLIFSNIRQMAKTLTLSQTGDPQDGAFETIKPMPMQLDGELARLEPGARVRVEIAAGVLETVL